MTSCIGAARRDDAVGSARVVLSIPLPTRSLATATAAGIDGPSEALLARAPAPVATDALVITPAAAFVENADAPDAERALDCLTQAVYYEARSEPVEGQRAVAQVVLNRVHNPAYPNSVCGTVYEGSRRATGCQFSFTCDGSLARRREPGAWARAAEVAGAALAGFVYAPVGTATYYHTTAVNPWWSARVTQVATIGAHIFYRLPGSWGGLAAFRQPYAGVEPVLTGGLHIAPRPVDQIVETLAFGVTIHRGMSATAPETASADMAQAPASRLATPIPAAFVSGVRIHRNAPAEAVLEHGVSVHRGAAEVAGTTS